MLDGTVNFTKSFYNLKDNKEKSPRIFSGRVKVVSEESKRPGTMAGTKPTLSELEQDGTTLGCYGLTFDLALKG